MDERIIERESGLGGGGLGIMFVFIFLLILFAAFRGTGMSGNAYAAPVAGCVPQVNSCGCGCVTNCETMKQGIIDSARTQYLIEQQASATREAVAAGNQMIATKIDFYEYQNLRDELQDSKTKNYFLEGKISDNAHFNAINARLSEIECKMLTKPKIHGIGYVCNGSTVPPVVTTPATA